jgi:hypothetical protein
LTCGRYAAAHRERKGAPDEQSCGVAFFDASSGVLFSRADRDIETDAESRRALAAYDAFLRGESAFDFALRRDSLAGLLGEGSARYAILDVTRDGVPELLAECREKVILGRRDGEIYPLYDSLYWSWGFEALNNGALVSRQQGGAPPHSYLEYFTIDNDGNKATSTFYARYADGERPDQEEYDTYWDMNADGGKYMDKARISKEQWDELNAMIEELGSDEIEWRRFDSGAGESA